MHPTSSVPNESRIEILDGFRCLAIMAVIGFHYFFFFGIYEQLPDYPDWNFLSSGYFGVQLFFMISGFVIYRSLERTPTIKEFLIKRYLRLAPAMILCSTITYVMIQWWNDSSRIGMFGSESPLDFLFSFTFINPDIWNIILHRSDISYIDGAYWSLWTEVVFYLFVSRLYFSLNKEIFLRTWFVLALILYTLRIFISPQLSAFTPGLFLPVSRAIYYWFSFFGIGQWGYFSLGIFFYTLWMKRRPSNVVWTIAVIIFLLEIYFVDGNRIRVLFPIIVGLWFIFLYRPQWLHFLHWRPFQVIGLISYPLYLLHETNGLVLTEKLIMLTNHSIALPWLLLIAIAVFAVLGYLVFAYFENPVRRWLKKSLLRKSDVSLR